ELFSGCLAPSYGYIMVIKYTIKSSKRRARMKVELEERGACKKGIIVEVSAEDMENRLKEHLSEFKKSVQIKGFRPGRTPAHIIERRYLKKIVEEMRLPVAAEVFEEIVKEKKLRVIGEPRIEDVKYERGEPLSFRAEFFVLPEVTVPSYKGLRITIPQNEAKEQEVNEEIEKLRKLKAQLVDVTDRPTKEGDRLLAEIVVSADGKELFNTNNGYLVVGMANIFGVNVLTLPKMLEGKRTADNIEFEFEIQKGTPLAGEKEENAGKKALCRIKILRVREVKIPDLSDDFAKEYGYNSIDDMRRKVAERITVEKRLRIDEETENRLMKYLTDSIKIELPEELLEEKARQHGEYIRERLEAETDMSEEEVEEAVKNEVKARSGLIRQVFLTHLLVEEIAKKEAIFVTEEEVDMLIKDLARRKDVSAEVLKEAMLESGRLSELRLELLTGKVKMFLRKNAVVSRGEDFSDVEPPLSEEKEKEEQKE
ncbi:MAG: trigger factor, partial [Planctomycetota bacterium]|nr:trigger factor [Planctomycetota bacterium]